MAPGSDSEGSVQFVDDDSQHNESVRDHGGSAPSRSGNFCIERNGVPQPRPTSTEGVKTLRVGADGPSGFVESYRTKRADKDREPRVLPQKRTRVSQPLETNTDLDVVEVEETVQKGPSSRGRSSATSNQQRTRYSERLQKKKGTLLEYNMNILRKDRLKRDKGTRTRQAKRHAFEKVSSLANMDSIDLVDDDEEKQRSMSSKHANELKKQSDHRSGDMTDQRKSPLVSGSDNEVLSVEEGEEVQEEEEDEETLHRQGKDSGTMDSSYTGSTHLIFEFPPGKRGKIRVTEEERGRLSQRKYLNDSLIDFYMKYHESDLDRRAKDLKFTATFFSSFFFGRLRRVEPIDYEGVKGWTKKVDIFTKKFVFVPICDSYHWSLIIVANLDKMKGLVDCKEAFSLSSTEAPRIIYLDSLDPKRGMEFGDTMRQYLVEEWLAKKMRMETNTATRKATSSTFKKIIPILRPNVPIQTNEYDCGLYLLNTFEMFLYNTDGLRDKLLSGYRDVRDVYSHVDITMLRKSIINLMDILEKQWLHEQLPREGEPSERISEDAKGTATAESTAAGTGNFVSGPLSEHADDVEKLADNDRGDMATSDRNATEAGENAAFVSHLVSTDSLEHVSLLDSGEFVDKQAQKTSKRELNRDLESAVGLHHMDRQPLNDDPGRHRHSNLPSTAEQSSNAPTKPQEEERALHRSTGQGLRSRTEENSIRSPASFEEVIPSRQHEELGQEANDGCEDESELMEVAFQSSSAESVQLVQEGCSGAQFSRPQSTKGGNKRWFKSP